MIDERAYYGAIKSHEPKATNKYKNMKKRRNPNSSQLTKNKKNES